MLHIQYEVLHAFHNPSQLQTNLASIQIYAKPLLVAGYVHVDLIDVFRSVRVCEVKGTGCSLVYEYCTEMVYRIYYVSYEYAFESGLMHGGNWQLAIGNMLNVAAQLLEDVSGCNGH